MIHFTAQHLSRRLFAVLCLALGVFAARYFDDPQTSTPTVIPVRLLGNPIGGGGGSGGYELPSAFGDRDFTEYEYGLQTHECSWQKGAEFITCVEERDAARNFVLQHWKTKKKAYIAVYLRCTECFTLQHIFTEPDVYGRWRIVRKVENIGYTFFDREDAYDVRYRRATAKERKRDGSTRLLSFLDRAGNEIDSF